MLVDYTALDGSSLEITIEHWWAVQRSFSNRF